MSKTMHERIKEREEKEKEEVINLLSIQVELEQKLVNLYKETSKDIKSNAVKHLLHMISLDSRKHIDICQLVIEILQGEDVLKEEKEELMTGLKQHMDLEKEAIERGNKILRNVWIQETKGLNELIKKWRNDEKEHHTMLKKLVGKTFFRIGDFDFSAALKSTKELEERYRKLKRKRV
jgi:rubrerythrin